MTGKLRKSNIGQMSKTEFAKILQRYHVNPNEHGIDEVPLVFAEGLILGEPGLVAVLSGGVLVATEGLIFGEEAWLYPFDQLQKAMLRSDDTFTFEAQGSEIALTGIMDDMATQVVAAILLRQQEALPQSDPMMSKDSKSS